VSLAQPYKFYTKLNFCSTT